MLHAFRRAAHQTEAEQSARTAISKLIVSYEKNEFSTHDGELFTAHLDPTLGSNLNTHHYVSGESHHEGNDPHRKSGRHEKLHVS